MALAADMARIIAQARARLQEAPRAVLSAVAADLVVHTPVDTGQLRASWGLATGSFADVAALAAAGLEHADLDRSGEVLDPSGQLTIARLQSSAQTVVIGQVASFVNTAPYAAFVEYGTDRMAPRAYMRGTLARAPMIAAAAIAGLNP